MLEHVFMYVCVHVQAKAMQQGPDAKGPAAAKGDSDALPGANFGPKYEAHVSEMQNKLDEASKRYCSDTSNASQSWHADLYGT
jgi:hypothetical protein